MPRCVPVFLGGVRIGAYTEEGTLGIDSQMAVAALRRILPEKKPEPSLGETEVNAVSVSTEIRF